VGKEYQILGTSYCPLILRHANIARRLRKCGKFASKTEAKAQDRKNIRAVRIMRAWREQESIPCQRNRLKLRLKNARGVGIVHLGGSPSVASGGQCPSYDYRKYRLLRWPEVEPAAAFGIAIGFREFVLLLAAECVG